MVSGDALQPTTRAAMERLRNEIATNKALGPHGGSVDELLRDIEAVCDGLAQQQATIDTLREAAMWVDKNFQEWSDAPDGDGEPFAVLTASIVALRQALQESRGQ